MFLTATSCIHLSSNRSVVSTKQNAWLCNSDYHIIQKRGQEGILIRGSTIYIPSLPFHSITRQKKATSTLNNPFSKQSFLFKITINKQHKLLQDDCRCYIPSRNSGLPDRLQPSMCNTLRQQSSLSVRPKRGRACSVQTVLRMSKYCKQGVWGGKNIIYMVQSSTCVR